MTLKKLLILASICILLPVGCGDDPPAGGGNGGLSDTGAGTNVDTSGIQDADQTGEDTGDQSDSVDPADTSANNDDGASGDDAAGEDSTGDAVSGQDVAIDAILSEDAQTDAVGGDDVAADMVGGDVAADQSTDTPTAFDTGNQTRLDYCEGSGPPVLVSDQGEVIQTTCTADLAQVTFRFALCTCLDYVHSDVLTVDAFDSSVGPDVLQGGSVGINGDLTLTGEANIGGSLWVAGAGGAEITNTTDVGLEVYVGGDLYGGGDITGPVAATVDGEVHMGTLAVEDELTVPVTPTLDGDISYSTLTETDSIMIPSPCDCTGDALLNIAGFVDAYSEVNDNEEIGLDPDQLVGADSPQTISLGCGRFYLSGISSTAEITINAEDRTVLFINGDVTIGNKFNVTLTEGAELDIFISGLMHIEDAIDLGSVENPARVRIYIGGDGTMQWNNQVSIGGNVYAPNARLEIGDMVEIFGSLFVEELVAGNKLSIHYDEAVLSGGARCDDPDPGSGEDMGTGGDTGTGGDDMDTGVGTDTGIDPVMCETCRDCGNQACTAEGTCGLCETSADCCPPLICRYDGICWTASKF